MSNSNMDYWDNLKQPPSWALKKITGGRLSGKTDINPQWRYKAMTDTFGPCGLGWKFQLEKLWIDNASEGEVFAFAQVSLYVKRNKEWSDPIPGVGGSMLVAKEKAGLHANDEAFKMAVTDALSTSMKMLGVAADIYSGLFDGSKYKNPEPQKEPIDPNSRVLSKEEISESGEVEEKGMMDVPEQNSMKITHNTNDPVEKVAAVVQDFTFLKKAAECKKKIGDVVYYSMLKGMEFNHSNQIERAEDKTQFLARLKVHINVYDVNFTTIVKERYDELGKVAWNLFVNDFVKRYKIKTNGSNRMKEMIRYHKDRQVFKEEMMDDDRLTELITYAREVKDGE